MHLTTVCHKMNAAKNSCTFILVHNARVVIPISEGEIQQLKCCFRKNTVPNVSVQGTPTSTTTTNPTSYTSGEGKFPELHSEFV